MSKGSWPRPRQVSREEHELRKSYAYGEIALAVFNRRLERIRNGRKKAKKVQGVR
jgi:hypothetical protein